MSSKISCRVSLSIFFSDVFLCNTLHVHEKYIKSIFRYILDRKVKNLGQNWHKEVKADSKIWGKLIEKLKIHHLRQNWEVFLKAMKSSASAVKDVGPQPLQRSNMIFFVFDNFFG